MRIPQSPENGSRDITVFILVGLAALAVFSFAWAGIRVIEQSRFLDRLLSRLHR